MAELTREQRELIVVGMEIVVEEFSENQRCGDFFEVQPNQIYDLCDEMLGEDSSGVRGKYKVKSKQPNSRHTMTLRLQEENRELKDKLARMAERHGAI